ncbi:MAG: hypothetical protein XXXJIFNMEKO3_LKCDNKCA_00041 (plasmid) [Candidatus Erwinia impunctatus]
MKIQTYPSSNNYFNTGISALCDAGFQFRRRKESLLVVCMAPWSVRKVVSASWLESWNESRVLIVSDTRFFPLARYFQLRNNRMIDICHITEFYGVLGDFLWSGKLSGREYDEGITHLTDMEYISLQSALEGMSAEKQALVMGISKKTVFTHRAASARKLSVKKLSHLLSPKILNSCHLAGA